MEIIILFIIIIIAVIGVWFKPIKGVRSLSAHRLKQELNDSQKVYIDVRTPEEFEKGHIRQFENMPVGSDYSQLPPDKEIVVICRTGNRSKQVCKQLKGLGYERVTNIRGGMGMY